MNENKHSQATLASTYAGKWPRSIAYISLALLLSIGFQFLASSFGFIEEMSFRSMASGFVLFGELAGIKLWLASAIGLACLPLGVALGFLAFQEHESGGQNT